MPAPVLDGTATGIASGTTTVAAALTTTGTNRIVCALIYVESNLATGRLWITGVSGGGLTWNKRTQVTTFYTTAGGTVPGQTYELWWAVASSALSAVTITATVNITFDDAAVVLFGVSGCNTTNPWDANASLAARLNNFNAVAPTFNGISTTQANDFLIFGYGTNSNQAIGTVPTGFTAINSVVNGGGTLFASVGAAYKAVTATASNQTYAWGSTISGGTTAAIFDALTADTGGSTIAPRPTYEILAKGVASSAAAVSVHTAGISANNVIVILSYCNAPSAAISSISGGGLTWVQRARSHGSSQGSLEIWYAQVSGPLADSIITINYAASIGSAMVEALSMTGCSTAIWDSNASLPKLLSNTSGGNWTPSVSSVSTSQAHDFILALTGTVLASASTIVLPPTGFTLCDYFTSPTGFGIGAQSRSSVQSGVTITWGGVVGDSISSSVAGEYVVDALTADASVVYAAGAGEADAAAAVTGAGARLAAGVGEADAAATVAGVGATIARAGAGEVDAAAAVTGVGATITVAAGAGRVDAGADVEGAGFAAAVGTGEVDAFADVRGMGALVAPPGALPFLPGLGWSVHRRPTFDTIVATHPSGSEVRLALWQNALWEFELSYDALASNAAYPGAGAQTLQTLMGFYLARGGQRGTFLFIDPDFNAMAGQGIGAGDGTTVAFPFVRVFGGQVEPVSWVTGVGAIYLDGVAQPSGWAVAGSEITFATPPASGVVVSADFSYGFICRFLEDTIDFEEFMDNLWQLKSLKFRQVRL